MDETIQEKRAWFEAYKALKKDGKMAEAETAYKNAKHVAKHAVWLAKSEAEKEEFTTVSPDGDGVLPNRWAAQTKMLLVRAVHNDAC